MSRKIFNVLTCTMWLSLPAVALRYRQLWNQLPERLATHFNAAGQPNGWMSREQSRLFNLEVLGLMLIVFTIVLFVMRWRHTRPAEQWVLLAAFWAQLGVMLFIFQSILDYSLYGRPVYTGPAIFAAPGVIVVCLLLGLRLAGRKNAGGAEIATHS